MYSYEPVPCCKILSNTTLLNEYEEEGKSSLLPKILPDWSMYQALEDLGILTFMGAKDSEGTIVGFVSILVTSMPHYSKLSATVESLFVRKQYRKFGTAKRLLDEAMEVAKSKGATILFMSAIKGGVLERFLPLRGLTPTHTTYIKVLDE